MPNLRGPAAQAGAPSPGPSSPPLSPNGPIKNEIELSAAWERKILGRFPDGLLWWVLVKLTLRGIFKQLKLPVSFAVPVFLFFVVSTLLSLAVTLVVGLVLIFFVDPKPFGDVGLRAGALAVSTFTLLTLQVLGSGSQPSEGRTRAIRRLPLPPILKSSVHVLPTMMMSVAMVGFLYPIYGLAVMAGRGGQGLALAFLEPFAVLAWVLCLHLMLTASARILLRRRPTFPLGWSQTQSIFVMFGLYAHLGLMAFLLGSLADDVSEDESSVFASGTLSFGEAARDTLNWLPLLPSLNPWLALIKLIALLLLLRWVIRRFGYVWSWPMPSSAIKPATNWHLALMTNTVGYLLVRAIRAPRVRELYGGLLLLMPMIMLYLAVIDSSRVTAIQETAPDEIAVTALISPVTMMIPMLLLITPVMTAVMSTGVVRDWFIRNRGKGLQPVAAVRIKFSLAISAVSLLLSWIQMLFTVLLIVAINLAQSNPISSLLPPVSAIWVAALLGWVLALANAWVGSFYLTPGNQTAQVDGLFVMISIAVVMFAGLGLLLPWVAFTSGLLRFMAPTVAVALLAGWLWLWAQGLERRGARR